jgi:hypothetical protein
LYLWKPWGQILQKQALKLLLLLFLSLFFKNIY